MLIRIAVIAALGICQGQDGSRPESKFEVASIRPEADCADRGGPRLGIRWSPGRLSVSCQTVDFLIREAYIAEGEDPALESAAVYNRAIAGSPAWLTTERYTIEARAEGTAVRKAMLGPMMRGLLEERLGLKIRRELREVPVYALTVARGGPKLRVAADAGCLPFDPDATGGMRMPQDKHFCGILIRSLRPGTAPASFYGATMADLCRGLARLVDREIVDKTEISGRFDIDLDLAASDLFPMAAMLRAASGDPDSSPGASEPRGYSVVGALGKLGLKLEPTKGPGEFLVIEHVERPSPN